MFSTATCRQAVPRLIKGLRTIGRHSGDAPRHLKAYIGIQWTCLGAWDQARVYWLYVHVNQGESDIQSTHPVNRLIDLVRDVSEEEACLAMIRRLGPDPQKSHRTMSSPNHQHQIYQIPQQPSPQLKAVLDYFDCLKTWDFEKITKLSTPYFTQKTLPASLGEAARSKSEDIKNLFRLVSVS